jgi:F-type H+-transporting ATPase subunit a
LIIFRVLKKIENNYPFRFLLGLYFSTFAVRKKKFGMNFFKNLGLSAVLFVFGFIMPNLFAQNHDHPADTGAVHEDHVEANHGNKEEAEEEDYFGSFVFHHISDDYMFQIFDDIYCPLPVIIFEPGSGLDVFLSNQLLEKDENHLSRGKYFYHHGNLVIAELDEHGHAKMDSLGHPVGKHEAKLLDVGKSDVFYNFSITKNVFGILLACAVIVLIFFSVASKYKKNPNSAPRGLQGALEPLILYVQDDVVKPSIGKKYERFLPYLLTLFFFIWINNMIGLIPFFPGSANVTGNIAVTFTLAFFALIIQVVNGNKNFWGHIFWFPGVPVPVKLLLAVIEFIGLFTKPFSLMIRLFANITAGHIIIMSIIGITFVMKSLALGFATSIFSVAMFVLELLVALIQAYIFTLLTSLMIGSALEEGHHDHHETAEAKH